jgi:Zn-dependent protease
METVLPNAAVLGDQTPTTPAEIFNCPNCSVWLQPGTMACPECQTIIYSAHLRTLAESAQASENAKQWLEARAAWESALAWLPADTKQYGAVAQRIGLIDTRLQAVVDNKARWSKRLGPFAPVLLFLSKVKTFLFFLLKAKFFFSFLAFFGLYAGLFGWKFGLGFAGGIMLHELGHYVEARRQGLKVDLPVFIPGMGAYVRWYSQGVQLESLSSIALAGPMFGLFVAAAFAGVAKYVGETYQHPGLWSALAHVAAWLNIVNLVPLFWMDGAQATFALDRMQRWLVLATTLIFFGWLQEWPFLFVALGMGWQIFRSEPAEKPSTRTLLQYVLILFFLGLIMYAFPDPMRRRY